MMDPLDWQRNAQAECSYKHPLYGRNDSPPLIQKKSRFAPQDNYSYQGLAPMAVSRFDSPPNVRPPPKFEPQLPEGDGDDNGNGRANLPPQLYAMLVEGKFVDVELKLDDGTLIQVGLRVKQWFSFPGPPTHLGYVLTGDGERTLVREQLLHSTANASNK
jgi:hypothetical protein